MLLLLFFVFNLVFCVFRREFYANTLNRENITDENPIYLFIEICYEQFDDWNTYKGNVLKVYVNDDYKLVGESEIEFRRSFLCFISEMWVHPDNYKQKRGLLKIVYEFSKDIKRSFQIGFLYQVNTIEEAKFHEKISKKCTKINKLVH